MVLKCSINTNILFDKIIFVGHPFSGCGAEWLIGHCGLNSYYLLFAILELVKWVVKDKTGQS